MQPLPNYGRVALCKQYRAKGGRVYGPYWFAFWREGGRLRKRYVRAGELEAARAEARYACDLIRLLRVCALGMRGRWGTSPRDTERACRDLDYFMADPDAFGAVLDRSMGAR